MDIFLNYHTKAVFATNSNIPSVFLLVKQISVLKTKDHTSTNPKTEGSTSSCFYI